MSHPHLIGIGKLGRHNADGFYPVMVKPDYRDLFAKLADLYLIFNSDRVFYVTISERMRKDNRTWIKLKEDGIAEEELLHKNIVIAIDDTETDAEETSLNYLLGYQVIFAGEEIGIVEDYIFNGAQDVLQISAASGNEYLIPFVEYYIDTIIDNPGCIILRNAKDLIDLYRVDLKKK